MTRPQPENRDTTGSSATPPELSHEPLERVLQTVRYLRSACPWDADQTPRSLLPYLIEEAHEVAESVEDGDDDALRSELGDLLLHVAFQIVLGEERDAFRAGEVADAVVAKMKRRHPHLYPGEAGTDVMDGSPAAWEAIKARERPGRSLVDGLARGLDPLSRAHRIQERVSGVGFDWADPSGALAKVREETEEVAQALESLRAAKLREGADPGPTPGPDAAANHFEEELGDLLFAAVNLARLAGSHGLHALGRANRKFTARFRALEDLARERGVRLGEASLEELDALWDDVKGSEGD